MPVNGRHLLHPLEGLDLHGDLLPLADNLVIHVTAAAVKQIVLLCLNEVIDAVKRHAAVVPHDAPAPVGIRQTGHDMRLAGQAHLRRVGSKNTIIVRGGVLCKNALELRVDGVAVGLRRLHGHLDTAVGHECTLERLIRLNAHNLLQILELLIDVARAVGGETADDLRLALEHAAAGALLLLELLQSAPELIRSLRGSGQEALAPVVGLVVRLDEVTHVDLVLPNAA